LHPGLLAVLEFHLAVPWRRARPATAAWRAGHQGLHPRPGRGEPAISGADFGVMPMARMRGALALVTGAGSGIGRATAIRFAAEGARVACVDRAAAAADETAAAIKGAGAEACGLAGDRPGDDAS